MSPKLPRYEVSLQKAEDVICKLQNPLNSQYLPEYVEITIKYLNDALREWKEAR